MGCPFARLCYSQPTVDLILLGWREQLRDMGDRAGDRLEGWLEDVPWDPEPESTRERTDRTPVTREVWDEEDWRDQRRQRDEDPWV